MLLYHRSFHRKYFRAKPLYCSISNTIPSPADVVAIQVSLTMFCLVFVGKLVHLLQLVWNNIKQHITVILLFLRASAIVAKYIEAVNPSAQIEKWDYKFSSASWPRQLREPQLQLSQRLLLRTGVAVLAMRLFGSRTCSPFRHAGSISVDLMVSKRHLSF